MSQNTQASWRSLRSKFFAGGIIVMATIVFTLMLLLPFISYELEEQLRQLERDQEANIRNEAITISRLLVFEFSRLQDLIDVLYMTDEDLPNAVIPIRNYLWEKVTFNEIIRDIQLMDESATLLLTPSGTAETLPADSEGATDIREHLGITNRVYITGEQSVFVFMPLYIEGNRWGIVKITISTEQIRRQLEGQIQRQHQFRNLILLLFVGALVLAGLVGVFILNILAAKITDPIKSLSRNAERFAAEGDVAELEEIEVENDEVGMLARNFNLMANDIARLLREKDDAYAKLKASQEQLRQSEKLATLGQLSGGIAHEINNALGPIRLRSEDLLMTIEEGGQAERDDLQVILRGIDQCSSIVQKLRDFSAPSLGGRSMINLNSVILETIGLVRSQLEKNRIEIELQLNDLPEMNGNASELEQVFMNMLLNSRDAIEAREAKRGGRITIETAAPGGSIEVRVRDNGVGMEEETITRMFEPFFTTKAVGAGTGLGMSVSFGILQSHGASISVNSQPGEGTQITVRFPLPPKKQPAAEADTP